MVVFILLMALGLVNGLPPFKMSLFFSSLQTKSDLPKQSGAYLQDSFREEVIAPFSRAVVLTLSEMDSRLHTIENHNLGFRVTIMSAISSLIVLIVLVIIIKRKGQPS